MTRMTLENTWAPTKPIDDATMRRYLPWHGIGTDVSGEYLSAQAAFERAGLLGWDLHKAPSYEGNPDDGFRVVPGAFHVVRPSDRRVFGTVGNVFEIHQPERTAEWVHDLADVGSIVNLGFSGNTLFCILKTELDQTGPDGSPLVSYMAVTDRFDGGGGLRASLLIYRKVCLNGMHGIINGNGVNLRHTSNIEVRKRAALEVLGMAQSVARRAAARAERLASMGVNFGAFLDKLVPLPADEGRGLTRAENTHSIITDIYRNAPDQRDMIGTAWGAVNAVAAYADHFQTRRNTATATAADNRLAVALAPSTASLTVRAMRMFGDAS